MCFFVAPYYLSSGCLSVWRYFTCEIPTHAGNFSVKSKLPTLAHQINQNINIESFPFYIEIWPFSHTYMHSVSEWSHYLNTKYVFHRQYSTSKCSNPLHVYNVLFFVLPSDCFCLFFLCSKRPPISCVSGELCESAHHSYWWILFLSTNKPFGL